MNKEIFNKEERTKYCCDCKHFGIKDDGYGPYERHDNFCWLRDEWLGSRSEGCDDFEGQEA